MSALAPSLRTRLLVVSALLVTLPLAAVLAAMTIVGNALERQSLASSVERGQLVQAHFREWRADQLALISRVFTSDAAFASYLSEATAGGAVDAASIEDLLSERQAELGFDFAVALDVEGAALARAGRAPGLEADLSADPLVRRAIDELVPATGLWRARDRLYQAAVVPVSKDRDLIGFIATGLGIDDALASEMSRIGGADVAFVATSPDRAPAVVASSLDLARTRELAGALAAREDLAKGGELLDLALGGERLAARVEPLADASGAPVALLLTMGSASAQAAAFRTLRGVVLATGLVGLLAALALTWVLTRRALAPVQQLAEAAQAAVAGDYTRKLDVPRDSDLGAMATAFNSLLRDLRERREMEAYVADLARRLPESAFTEPTLPAAAAFAPTVEAVEDTRRSERRAPEDAGTQPSRALPPGTVIDARYEIRGLLGSGGMGVVHAAFDHELEEVVALKVLRPEVLRDARQLEMLKNELKVARKITHPNVLRTYDYGEHDGVPYISMEHVRGMTLRYLLRERGALPPAPAAFLLRQVAEGLAVAHAAGILHRDVKPENVILDQHGHARIMDFGIAMPFRKAGDASDQRAWLGTPRYIAPEILEGATPDVQGDVYALGVLAYELFTGRQPFEDGTLDELVAAKRRPLRKPSEWRAGLPPEIDSLVMRCLDPDPARRFRTVSDVLRALAP